MKMIIGGAYQGKYEYVRQKFKIKDWIDGSTCKEEEVFKCEGINYFHEYIRRQMQEGKSVEHLAEEIIDKNPNLLIISNEVGYGVVPVGKFEREYREKVGRICTQLAEYSTQVHRVVCGIGTVIKDV